MTSRIIWIIAYLVMAPLAACLITGAERKFMDRLQKCPGPSLIQPYYDIRKLLEKDDPAALSYQDFFIVVHMLFTTGAGAVFFAGGDLLLVIFLELTGAAFLIAAAYSSGSPYSVLGARRYMNRLLASEPMMIFTAAAFYIFKDSLMVREIARSGGRAFLPMIGLFLGFIYIMTIRSGRNPFDPGSPTSRRHELAGGLSTEFSGRALAFAKLARWYDTILLYGILFLFFCNGRAAGYLIGILVCVAVYLLQILSSGLVARMKDDFMIRSAWILTIAFGLVNLFVLQFIIKGV